MPTFVYTAKKSTAETVNGTITAENQDEAIELIHQLGFLPVTVEAAEETRIPTEGIVRRRSLAKIKGKDLYLFTRQLARLLRSGVPLPRALMLIREQTTHPVLSPLLTVMEKAIRDGRSFSEALADFPEVFSPLYLAMVRAGEESGNLQEMLWNIAGYQQRQQEMVAKVRTALIYPLVMMGVGAATVGFVMTFVLPKMGGLFEGMGRALPLSTRILLGTSEALSRYWWIWVTGLSVLGIAAERFRRSESGRRLLSRVWLRLPVVGSIILKAEVARFCRALVLLLKSGVSIIRALPIVIPLLSNDMIKARLTLCASKVTGGEPFGESLRQTGALPVMMAHLITLGEEAGNLNQVLTEMAETYEQETDEQIKVMTTLLEPLMILVIGVVVGFIVFSVLLPIFQMDVLE